MASQEAPTAASQETENALSGDLAGALQTHSKDLEQFA